MRDIIQFISTLVSTLTIFKVFLTCFHICITFRKIIFFQVNWNPFLIFNIEWLKRLWFQNLKNVKMMFANQSKFYNLNKLKNIYFKSKKGIFVWWNKYTFTLTRKKIRKIIFGKLFLDARLDGSEVGLVFLICNLK